MSKTDMSSRRSRTPSGGVTNLSHMTSPKASGSTPVVSSSPLASTFASTASASLGSTPAGYKVPIPVRKADPLRPLYTGDGDRGPSYEERFAYILNVRAVTMHTQRHWVPLLMSRGAR